MLKGVPPRKSAANFQLFLVSASFHGREGPERGPGEERGQREGEQRERGDREMRRGSGEGGGGAPTPARPIVTEDVRAGVGKHHSY